MSQLICDGCIFYHPGRQRKKCSCIPRAVPEEMKKCSVRLEALCESVLAMRVRTSEDIEQKPEEKRRRKK